MEFPAAALPPGDYHFGVQAPEPWYIVSARLGGIDLLATSSFELAQRKYDNPVQFVVEIREGGAALEGLVVNDKGEPLSGGAMCALAGDPARVAQPGGVFCVRADGDGTFRSRWMSPGDWTIWAFTKKPHESPADPAFVKKHAAQAREVKVPENGNVGRLRLLAIE